MTDPGATDKPLDTLAVMTMPWVFTQSHPLTTSDVINEAKERGIELDAPTLRELYRRGDLAPLVEVTTRAVTEPRAVHQLPRVGSTSLATLQHALTHGRVRDLSVSEFRPRLRFGSARISDPQGWWNGLIYSRWQLLVLPDLHARLAQRRIFGPYEHRRVVLPPLDQWSKPFRDKTARWALVLTALEAAYLPEVVPEWLHLVNAEVDDWRAHRHDLDPVALADTLHVSATEVRTYAESMLSRARGHDPTGRWSELIRRGTRESWKTLSGDARIALDYRLAAEMLLLFYEDLVQCGVAEALPDLPRTAWHPLRERISDRSSGELDNLLAGFGISPHPGVVLVVEGEVEELLVPRVFDRLGLSRAPDRIRVLCMRGADKELPLVAAATAAPILGERRGDKYDMIRPPTRLVIAIDQDGRWNSPAKIQQCRNEILQEIRKVVAAQGASVADQELGELVIVQPWNARCFEFAHFTDEELADAMAAVHSTCGGLDRDALVARIADVRGRNLDVKDVWNQEWVPKPKKPELADALWPILAAKIDAARTDPDGAAPQVAEVIVSAYRLAMRANIGNFVMRAGESEE